MSFIVWLALGLGVFLLYSAYKGNNPWESLIRHLGVKK